MLVYRIRARKICDEVVLVKIASWSKLFSRNCSLKTKEALEADNWDAVVGLWQPWVEQGDTEAQYQLAYHYLWYTPCDDDATRGRMKQLVTDAASKDHPDALWFLATHTSHLEETNPEFERLLLRAGHLGSVNAQRTLGAMHAMGDWSGPKDFVEAARWYRLAAEKGYSESQYALGSCCCSATVSPRTRGRG